MLGNLEIPDQVKQEIMAKLGITPIPYCENNILYYSCNFRLYRLLTNENTSSGCFKHGANS
jgi:hypothetical protein